MSDSISFKFETAMKLKNEAPAGDKILNECIDIALMLLGKNISYGNSAIDPINIFSKINAIEQINVRIDDKLNRIKKGSSYLQEDTVKDLIGYLVLKIIAEDDMEDQKVSQKFDKLSRLSEMTEESISKSYDLYKKAIPKSEDDFVVAFGRQAGSEIYELYKKSMIGHDL